MLSRKKALEIVTKATLKTARVFNKDSIND